MQVIRKHSATIEWQHELADRFEGLNSESADVRLSAAEPKAGEPTMRTLTIDYVHVCVNRPTHAVFLGKTRTTFEIADALALPAYAFLTDLVDEVRKDFERVYHEEVTDTNLHGHQLPAFTAKSYRDNIQECINNW